MNEKTLQNPCLELVTINGRPFKLMDDSVFRKILNPLLEDMRAKFTVNAENIRQKIREKTNDAHYRIKLKVEGKLVSLKADVATRGVHRIRSRISKSGLSGFFVGFGLDSDCKFLNFWIRIRIRILVL